METATTRRTIPIRNLVHGQSQCKKPKIEVGVFHTSRQDEEPQILAKFCVLGDAWRYARQIAGGNVWYQEVVIRV